MNKPVIGLVRFLGSNCDQDCADAISYLGYQVEWLWHDQTELPPRVEAVILPGGFSYGDFLRSGALAAHSRIMGAVRDFSSKGGPILGICNGFQTLVEMQLLPGCLLPNSCGRFVCKTSELKLGPGDSLIHRRLRENRKENWKIPIAHGDGRYFVENPEKLFDQGQVLFTYKENPNGSVADIAGVMSVSGRIVGMMPHPERALYPQMSHSQDGQSILEAFFEGVLS